MERHNIAEVIPLKMNVNKGFYYLIPLEFEKFATIGKRVKINFKNKERYGIIVKFTKKTEIKNLKEIEEIIDPFPVLSSEVLDIANWISEYYLCPKGIVINHILPAQISIKKIASFFDYQPDKWKYLKPEDIENNKEEQLYEKWNHEDFLFDKRIAKQNNDSPKPILFYYHNYKVRDRYYSRWISKVLKQGKQVLILIPDQWCCIDLKQKLAKRYDNILGFFDKKVSQTQKYLRFFSVDRENIKVVIGTRSSVFLPFRNVGLIIVEQEDSLLYKEERVPHYNARDVALMRGKVGKYQVILGSFAPSIESFWHSINKKYILKTEKSLARYHLLFPKIQIVNMEEEKSFQRLISYQLQQEIVHNLKEKKKVILFLNRRGFAGYMVCSHCGYVIKCPECGHILSYHVEENTQWTVCHACGKRIKMVKYCPKCGKGEIKPLGAGTQSIERLIKKMFPKKTIQRLDIDIAVKINDQKKIINDFNRGKIDILVGTQIIFRELNYHSVGLVAFILADHLLNIPDYHSAESSYQFIYQLVLNLSDGNASKTLFIQTYQPQHHALIAVKQLDYQIFYQEEMKNRDELKYPPFSIMIKIDFIGKGKDQVSKSALDFVTYIHQSGFDSEYNLKSQLSIDNLMITKNKEKNKASFSLRIDFQKQNIFYFKEVLFKYVLKYKSNDVKLLVDVDPTKMC